MAEIQELAATSDAKERQHVTVIVNKHHVVFHRHEATGAQIKATAIEQGVAIQQDFNLSKQCPAFSKSKYQEPVFRKDSSNGTACGAISLPFPLP